jgi:predicted HAD superfamily Cof-like phosphohydrolase
MQAWADVIDGMCDIMVVVNNTSNAMGIDLEPFFDEVHKTNMAKVGGPKNEFGKALKPEGWKPPRIREMLEGLVRES